jgi:hypothetical protein
MVWVAIGLVVVMIVALAAVMFSMQAEINREVGYSHKRLPRNSGVRGTAIGRPRPADCKCRGECFCSILEMHRRIQATCRGE